MAKLRIDRGCTHTIEYTHLVEGVATSLVGATLRFTIKSAEWDTDTTDSTAILVKNVTSGAADGTASIVLTPADTATITPGNYRFDIKVDETSDNVTIYKGIEGIIVIDGSPTNRLA